MVLTVPDEEEQASGMYTTWPTTVRGLAPAVPLAPLESEVSPWGGRGGTRRGSCSQCDK